MNTLFLLMAEYGTPTVPLNQVCEKYFGLSAKTAEKRAQLGELPIPTFRGTDSQKAPRLVSLQDLAQHLDSQRLKGIELFEKMKSDH